MLVALKVPWWHHNSAKIFRLVRQCMGLMTSQLHIFRARSIIWGFGVPKLILLFTRECWSAQPCSINFGSYIIYQTKRHSWFYFTWCHIHWLGCFLIGGGLDFDSPLVGCSSDGTPHIGLHFARPLAQVLFSEDVDSNLAHLVAVLANELNAALKSCACLQNVNDYANLCPTSRLQVMVLQPYKEPTNWLESGDLATLKRDKRH